MPARSLQLQCTADSLFHTHSIQHIVQLYLGQKYSYILNEGIVLVLQDVHFSSITLFFNDFLKIRSWQLLFLIAHFVIPVTDLHRVANFCSKHPVPQ